MNPPSSHRSRLIAAHERFLTEQNEAWFEISLRQTYLPGTLQAILERGDVADRIAAAAALGLVGNCQSLADLGLALSDPDRGVRSAADAAFHELLIRSLGLRERSRLRQVIRLNESGEYAAALAPALILADQSEQHAEVHHQLAICWYGLDQHDAATAAYLDCVARCCYHYSAWLGLARCRVAMGDLNGAIEVLNRALEVSPDLESARTEVQTLRRKARQDSAE